MLSRRLGFLSIFFLLMCFVCVGNVTAADLKIAVMSTQKVLGTSIAGKKVKVAVEAKAAAFESTIKEEKAAVTALQEEVKTKSSLWSDDVKKEKFGVLGNKSAMLKSKVDGMNRELNKFEREQVDPVLKKLEEILKAYAEKNGYSIVLERNAGVVFNDRSLDISEDLIKELDAVMK